MSFKMHPAANYSVSQYPGTSASNSRQRRTSQTISSAFSACANPNEDWTEISDFEERRRIQTRIAQRNYRIKQKQRVEQAENRVEKSPPTTELTNEELASPVSASDFSPTNGQQQEMHNFYDIASPVSASDFSPTDGQQQEMHNFYDNASPETVPQQQSLPLSDDFVMPLQQITPQLSPSQPLCSDTAISGTGLCLLHTSGQQQQLTAHNFCNSHIPMTLQPQFLAPQFSTSQPPCVCIPTSEYASCRSQLGGLSLQQQMQNLYYRMPFPYTSWAGSEDYARASYGQFDISCGPPSAAVNLNSPFVFPTLPSNPYITLPSPTPTKRGYCCHHNTYLPTIEHAMPMFKGWDVGLCGCFQ